MSPADWHGEAMDLAWMADRGEHVAAPVKRGWLTRAAWLEVGAAHAPAGVLPAVVLWYSAGWLCVQAGLYAEGEACVRQALVHGASPAYVDELLTAAQGGPRTASPEAGP